MAKTDGRGGLGDKMLPLSLGNSRHLLSSRGSREQLQFNGDLLSRGVLGLVLENSRRLLISRRGHTWLVELAGLQAAAKSGKATRKIAMGDKKNRVWLVFLVPELLAGKYTISVTRNSGPYGPFFLAPAEGLWPSPTYRSPLGPLSGL